MGIRINRAVGWGMKWDDFSACTILQRHDPDDKFYPSEELYDTMNNIKDMTVSAETRKKSWDEPGPCIFHTNLLEYGNHDSPSIGHARDLYVRTGYEMDGYIMFFPDISTRRRSYHHDDHLDYLFEQYRSDDSLGEEARDFYKFLRYNPYPRSNDLMLDDGTHVPWDYFTTVDEHPEWLPAVPPELRWWLPHYGILALHDVLRLRPMISQWWG